MKIPISSIIIGPRQRLEIGDLSDLDSMADPNVGLIQRIGINERNVLLWGRRRLAKATSLGWTHIDVEVKSGLTPEQEQLVEWSEDFDRRNRKWTENCIALAKLHRMMELKEGFSVRGSAGAWTVKKTEELTGISKSKVSIMLIVADALEKEYDDHKAGKPTVWDAPSYTEGYKTLVLRHEKEVNAEIERRRALANPPKVAGVTEAPLLESSAVPSTDSTGAEAAPPRSVVKLHGRQTHYHLSDDLGMAPVILGYNIYSEAIPAVITDLRDNGFAILWFNRIQHWRMFGEDFARLDLHVLPFPLIWNKVRVDGNCGWPWASNMAYGLVVSKSEQLLCADPSGAVIAAVPDGDVLPTSVIDHSISKICTEKMAVTCVCGVDPLSVIELGRVPIWYEPDKEKFDTTNACLKAYYEEQLPNVEVQV